ncbi:MAG: hypothetical protein ACOYU7_07695, partial [Bacillota bacterium]
HFPTLQHLVGHLRLLQSKVSFAGGWVNSFSALLGHFKPGADTVDRQVPGIDGNKDGNLIR